MSFIEIGNRKIGKGNPVFIIAELSANHLQDFTLAVDTVKAMINSGADAVKVQTLTPDTMTINCENLHFRIKAGTPWDGKTFYELYSQTPMPWEWHYELKKIVEDAGLVFFSTPYDKTAVDFLETLDVPAYKIASFEIIDIPLIEYVASKGKPIFISTGIATLPDIEEAVNACIRVGNNQIALLKCNSTYPTLPEELNLITIQDLEKRFQTVVGLSNHTLGDIFDIAAVVIGASIIEKHFILNRQLGGPDSDFSMEPSEFKQMVDHIRSIKKSLGKINYELDDKLKKSRECFSRSLFVVIDIQKGDLFTEENIKSIRPGIGLPPKFLTDIIGKRANKNISRGTPVKWNMIGA